MVGTGTHDGRERNRHGGPESADAWNERRGGLVTVAESEEEAVEEEEETVEEEEETEPDEETEAESSGADEGEEGDSIEDLFKGEQDDAGDDGEEPDDEDEAADPEEDDDGEGDDDSSEDDGEDDEGAADDEDEDDEEEDGAANGEATSGGIDDDLAVVEDRTTPPRSAGADPDGGRLSTGIDELDDRLGGGIPPGRILSFVATADTQSELLVKHLAAQHDCLYLSTLRPKWEVEEEVRDYVQMAAATTGGTSVQIEQLTPDSRLDSARRYVEKLDGRTVVVIDSANELESREKERYVYFIDELKRKLWETGSVGLLYCIEEPEPSEGRDVTLRRADLIWQLRPPDEAEGLNHDLLISKFRSGRALTEPLMLSLTDEVRVESD